MVGPEANGDVTPVVGRRQRLRERMRERLLTAALELFAEHGFAGTTIDEISERADVARQTVLNHFPHKSDFARAWGQGRRDQVAAIGEEASAEGSAWSAIRRYFDALVEMNERERDLTRAMLESLTPTEIFMYVPTVPTAVLQRGQERGEFGPTLDPGAASDVLAAVYFGTVSRWLAEGPRPFDLAATLAQRLELVLVGLRRS